MTEPDASLGGRDTHTTIRQLLERIKGRHGPNPSDGLDILCQGCGNIWLAFSGPEGCGDYLDAVAALAQLDAAPEGVTTCRYGPSSVRIRTVPDPVASSPGAPLNPTQDDFPHDPGAHSIGIKPGAPRSNT